MTSENINLGGVGVPLISCDQEASLLRTRDQLMNSLLSPSVPLRGVARLNVPHHVLNVQNGTINLERMTVRWKSVSRPPLQSTRESRISSRRQPRTTATLAHENRSSFSDQSFISIGLEPSLVQALQKAFPNIKQPTKVQDRLITEILAGKDVLLKDGPGSGKYSSFLFIIWL